MRPSDLVRRRLRGFRVVDLAAAVVMLALALTVYAFKTSAGSERAETTDVEARIADERTQVRLLTAEVARLESPGRLERLARVYADQAPVSARQEIAVDSLPTVATAEDAP